MLSKLKNFIRNEDAAVTVDFVVLTAAVVGMSVWVVIGIVNEGVFFQADWMCEQISDDPADCPN